MGSEMCIRDSTLGRLFLLPGGARPAPSCDSLEDWTQSTMGLGSGFGPPALGADFAAGVTDPPAPTRLGESPWRGLSSTVTLAGRAQTSRVRRPRPDHLLPGRHLDGAAHPQRSRHGLDRLRLFQGQLPRGLHPERHAPRGRLDPYQRESPPVAVASVIQRKITRRPAKDVVTARGFPSCRERTCSAVS